MRAMEKNPKKRYATAQEMLTDIRALRQNSKAVFGNEKNSSRYKIIDRKPFMNASNVSNRGIMPISDRGVDFADNQGYFKRNTSHSGTFNPRSEQIHYTGRTAAQTGRTIAIGSPAYQTGRTAAQTGRTIAIGASPSQTGRTRVPSGAIPPMHSQKLPKATNTVAIDDEKIVNELKQSKFLSILLGIISALLIVIAVSLVIWFNIAPNNRALPNYTQQINSETEIEWITEHTEKF